MLDRARLWRRLIAFCIDVFLITLVLEIVAVGLFFATNGRVQMGSGSFVVRQCETEAYDRVGPGLQAKVQLPPDFRPTAASLCSTSLVGFPTGRSLTVVEANQSTSGGLTITTTRSITEALDRSNNVATDISFVSVFVLVAYFVWRQSRAGQSLGKRLTRIACVSAPDQGTMSTRQALVRNVALFGPFLLFGIGSMAAQLFPTVFMKQAFAILAGFAVVLATLVLIQIISIVVSSIRGKPLFHDRLAGTDVVRIAPAA